MLSTDAGATRCSVCHLTSAHYHDDVRIFQKECCSLARAGYEVFIIAPGVEDKTLNHNVKIRGVVNANRSRVSRMTSTVWKVFKRACEIDADIYHIHDPELLPIAMLLKIRGKKVIYDVHEDLPKQMLSKPYLNIINARIFAYLAGHIENFVSRRIDGIVTVTPDINKRFALLNRKVVNINNYPEESVLFDDHEVANYTSNRVCYVGGMTQIRGIIEIINSLEFTNAELVLAGTFISQEFENLLRQNKNWRNVIYRGYVARQEAFHIMKESACGIVTYLPHPNHVKSQPIKLFEYMMAGLPIIASNFPHWQEIIEGNRCGICVDPMNPKEIAEAINYITSHPAEAIEMGKNGEKAVREHYNWQTEESKLLSFYRSLAGREIL